MREKGGNNQDGKEIQKEFTRNTYGLTKEAKTEEKSRIDLGSISPICL